MRIPSFRSHINRGSIDDAMTPMIDVVFLLLIFFVCASVGQVSDALLPTELAAGGVAAALPPEEKTPLGELWVKLLWQSNTTVAEVNGAQYGDLTALVTVLGQLQAAGAAADMPVILDVAPGVPLGDVIHVYDICLSTGFASIHFATGN